MPFEICLNPGYFLHKKFSEWPFYIPAACGESRDLFSSRNAFALPLTGACGVKKSGIDCRKLISFMTMNLVKKSGVCAIFALLMFTNAWGQQSDRDRGIDLYREGKFTEAISALESAVGTNENDRIAWIFLGGSYIHADDEKKAMSAFTRSYEVKPPIAPPLTYDRSIKVIEKPQPRYTRAARESMSAGKIRVAVEFRSDGTIGFIFPIVSKMNDLVAPSIEAAKGIRFEPALKDGKPVTVIMSSSTDIGSAKSERSPP